MIRAFQSFKVLCAARWLRTLSRRWFCKKNQHALCNGDMATHHDAALTTTMTLTMTPNASEMLKNDDNNDNESGPTTETPSGRERRRVDTKDEENHNTDEVHTPRGANVSSPSSDSTVTPQTPEYDLVRRMFQNGELEGILWDECEKKIRERALEQRRDADLALRYFKENSTFQESVLSPDDARKNLAERF